MFQKAFNEMTDNVVAISQDMQQHTYRELHTKSHEFSQHITEKKLIFNLCCNTFSSLSNYVGFLENTNCKQVLLSYNIDESLLINLIELYSPNYICLPANMEFHLESYRSLLENEDYILLEAKEHYSHDLLDELAIMLSTSGSTGSPKLVKLSYQNLLSNAQSIAEYLNIEFYDRAITTLPMNYAYGLSIINSHLLKGASIALTENSIAEKQFWEFLKKTKSTTFGGVPFTYEVLKRLRFNKMELPSIKYVTQAGGKLRKELVSEFVENCERKEIRFIIMYGQTEATARMSYLPWELAKSHPSSIGIAIPGGEFQLVDEEGKTITEINTPGELIYKGNNVFIGYSTTKDDLGVTKKNNHILHTGDIAYKDNNGLYYITGRKSRFIKVYGHRVNLGDIENLLAKQNINAACSGVYDKLVIFTTDHEKLDFAKKYISQVTKIHPLGIASKFIKEIPRNEFGKVKYKELQKMLEQGN